jgi:hypothetical protein
MSWDLWGIVFHIECCCYTSMLNIETGQCTASDKTHHPSVLVIKLQVAVQMLTLPSSSAMRQTATTTVHAASHTAYQQPLAFGGGAD